MAAPKLYVNSLADRDKVREVLTSVKPRGATLHIDGKHPVWLFKPTEKGGTTVARIIDQSGDEAVGEMIREVWNEIKDSQE